MLIGYLFSYYERVGWLYGDREHAVLLWLRLKYYYFRVALSKFEVFDYNYDSDFESILKSKREIMDLHLAHISIFSRAV